MGAQQKLLLIVFGDKARLTNKANSGRRKTISMNLDLFLFTCMWFTSEVTIHTFRMPVTETATTVSSMENEDRPSRPVHQTLFLNGCRESSWKVRINHGLTLCSVRSNNTHGADPVRRNLWHQGIKNFEAGSIHDKNFWVVAVTQQSPFALGSNCELIELNI